MVSEGGRPERDGTWETMGGIENERERKDKDGNREAMIGKRTRKRHRHEYRQTDSLCYWPTGTKSQQSHSVHLSPKDSLLIRRRHAVFSWRRLQMLSPGARASQAPHCHKCWDHKKSQTSYDNNDITDNHLPAAVFNFRGLKWTAFQKTQMAIAWSASSRHSERQDVEPKELWTPGLTLPFRAWAEDLAWLPGVVEALVTWHSLFQGIIPRWKHDYEYCIPFLPEDPGPLRSIAVSFKRLTATVIAFGLFTGNTTHTLRVTQISQFA